MKPPPHFLTLGSIFLKLGSSSSTSKQSSEEVTERVPFTTTEGATSCAGVLRLTGPARRKRQALCLWRHIFQNIIFDQKFPSVFRFSLLIPNYLLIPSTLLYSAHLKSHFENVKSGSSHQRIYDRRVILVNQDGISLQGLCKQGFGLLSGLRRQLSLNKCIHILFSTQVSSYRTTWHNNQEPGSLYRLLRPEVNFDSG